MSSRRRERRGELPEPAPEARFDAARDRHGDRQRETAAELRGGQSARQLEQRERIAVTLDDDAVEHLVVDTIGERRAQQHQRIGFVEAVDGELGQTAQVTRDGARPERERDTLVGQATGDEAECVRRPVVEPLGVVDDAQHRSFARQPRQEVERGESHEQPIGCGAGASPNATLNASRCGRGSSSRCSTPGAHSCCNAANGSSCSASLPTMRRTRNPSAFETA